MRFVSWSAVCQILSSLSVVVGLIVAGGTLQAQPAKPNPAAAKQAQTASENSKKQAADLATKYASATGDTKTAADALAAALTTLSAAQEKASKAYEAGIASDVTAAAAEVAKDVAAVAHARELLGALEFQTNFASEAQHAAWRKSTADSAVPQLEALLTARKTAAAAFGKLAAALTANAPVDFLDAARDETFTATSEATLANRAWTSARDIATRTALAAKTNNADLVAKIDDLKKTEAELFSLIKQQNELQLKLRKLERQRLQAAATAAELAKSKKK